MIEKIAGIINLDTNGYILDNNIKKAIIETYDKGNTEVEIFDKGKKYKVRIIDRVLMEDDLMITIRLS